MFIFHKISKLKEEKKKLFSRIVFFLYTHKNEALDNQNQAKNHALHFQVIQKTPTIFSIKHKFNIIKLSIVS
jgi:hypothetical protein